MFTSKTLTKDRPMQRPIRPPTLEIRLAHVNPYKMALKKDKDKVTFRPPPKYISSHKVMEKRQQLLLDSLCNNPKLLF